MFQTLQKCLSEKRYSASNSSLDSSVIQKNYLECQLLNSRRGPFPMSMPQLLISSRRMLALLEKLKSTCLKIRYTYEVSTNMFYFHILPKRFSQVQYKIKRLAWVMSHVSERLAQIPVQGGNNQICGFAPSS